MYSELNITIKDSYKINFSKKRLFFNFKKSFDLHLKRSQFDRFLDKDKNDEFYIKTREKFLNSYNFKNLDNIIGFVDVYNVGNRKNIHTFNIWFYFLVVAGEQIIVAELMDISVEPKYRSSGIGKKCIEVLEQICKENNVSYIVGELQADRFNEPLEKRIKFFENNGFDVWFDKPSMYSGYVCKKKLN